MIRTAFLHKALEGVVDGQILFHKNCEQPVEKLGSNWTNEGKLRRLGAMIKKHAKKILLINKALFSYMVAMVQHLEIL